MPAPNPLTSTDQIRSWVSAINTWFNYIVGLVSNLTSGHIHNGTDSRKVNHTDLNFIGTNTHSKIDSALTDSSNHIANTDVHVTTGNKADWDGVVTEVENARNSTAKSTIYESLDDRLEAIETSSTPEAHGNLSGRDTEATSVDPADHAHVADALWDSTESQTVQDTLDEKLTESDLSTAINALTDNTIDGDTIETATDTSKGTMLLGATGGAATFNHTHDFSDTAIESSHRHDDFNLMGEAVKVYVNDRLSSINQGSFLKNEILNGVFTFAGYDGSNNGHSLGQANATYNRSTGIPGWTVDTSSDTNFSARVVTSNIGTPPWSDWENSTLRHRGRHGNAILELHSTDWTPNQTNKIYSNIMCLDSSKHYTIFFWYRTPTAATVMGHNSYLEYWNGSTWSSVEIIEGGSAGFGGVNDTDWHQVRVAGVVGYKFVRLVFESASTTEYDSYDIQIARVGVFEGIWESSEHILPEAWFSPHIDYHSSIKTSTTSDILAVPENTWVEWNAYKKTYYTSLPVTASWIGSGTLTIPDFNYIYNIKITPSYCPTVPVPTEPPTAVPAWYAYWTQSGAQNFNGSSNTVNVYFPAPTETGNVTIEVDYWPADIPDADLP